MADPGLAPHASPDVVRASALQAAALRDPIAPETGELDSHEHRAPTMRAEQLLAGCQGALLHDARVVVEVLGIEHQVLQDVLIALPIHESKTRF